MFLVPGLRQLLVKIRRKKTQPPHRRLGFLVVAGTEFEPATLRS